MKLTDAQFGFLGTLIDHGPQTVTEVHGPRGMDGKRKITLQGSVAGPTLTKLEDAAMIHVVRGEAQRPVNAVGKPGNRRVTLTIEITAAGREAYAAA